MDKDNIQEQDFEKMRRWCQTCKMETTQYVKLYNPDNAEDGEVWECHYCKENTGWASPIDIHIQPIVPFKN